MNPTVKTTSSGGGFAKMKAELEKLSRKQVYVGIPEDKTSRKAGAVTNAGLLYIHTHGSALQKIPARPVIEPAIEASDNKAMITSKLGEAAKAALDGHRGPAMQALQKAGMLGRNAAIRWFTDGRNGWAPNSPATAARKGSNRPLVDTAQMRRSITYIVDNNDK